MCLYVVVIKNLEGEHKYGNKTLATYTILKSQLCREVVNILPVRVKVRETHVVCLAKVRKLCIRAQEHICAHQTNHSLCI